MNNIATIGHNNPPSDEELLSQKLNTNYAAEIDKIDALELVKLPETVDETTTGKYADYLQAIDTAEKAIEAAHKTEKAPYLKLGKIVDGFKNRHLEKLTKISDEPKKKQFAFLQKKADDERKRVLAAAAETRRKADELAAQAEAHAKEGVHDTAAELMDAAYAKDETAIRIQNYALTSKDSKLARTISENGAVSGLRTSWVPEIENIGAINPAEIFPYLKEEHIQLALNAMVKEGIRKIAGVKVYKKSTLR